jgi:hypothetical protein
MYENTELFKSSPIVSETELHARAQLSFDLGSELRKH